MKPGSRSVEQDAGDHLGAGRGGLEQRLEEARLADDVVVEQDHGVTGAGGDRAVQRRAEAEVLAQLDQLHLGEIGAQQLLRPVAGAVVDDRHPGRPRLLAKADEERPETGGAIEVGDVDRCLRSHRFAFGKSLSTERVASSK